LIDVSRSRWVFKNLLEAQESYVDLKVFCFVRVFEDHVDACKWKDGKTNKDPIPIDSSDSSSDKDYSKSSSPDIWSYARARIRERR
jgi:hypothetical protein